MGTLWGGHMGDTSDNWAPGGTINNNLPPRILLGLRRLRRNWGNGDKVTATTPSVLGVILYSPDQLSLPAYRQDLAGFNRIQWWHFPITGHS